MAFDPLVANPGRLEILTALAGAGRHDFPQLRRRTSLTDGNLASHAKRLRAAGLIDVEKAFRDGKPVTSYTLTGAGRAALEAHVRRLIDVVGPSAVARDDERRPADPVWREPVAVAVDADDDEPWID